MKPLVGFSSGGGSTVAVFDMLTVAEFQKETIPSYVPNLAVQTTHQGQRRRQLACGLDATRLFDAHFEFDLFGLGLEAAYMFVS